MGRLATILDFIRKVLDNGAKVSEVKVDLAVNDISNVLNIQPAGQDGFPLKTDQAFVVNETGTGKKAAIGYLDTINDPVAVEGEERLIGRDTTTGLVVVELHLKNDGEATILNEGMAFTCTLAGSIKGSNASGSFELLANGTFVINGVTINPSGDIDTPTKITTPSAIVNSKELAEHDHAINGGSSAPGPTGPNN